MCAAALFFMMTGGANAMLVALSKGYVVAAPGARGRTTQAADGTYTGKAPALIVDMKAAVRYLRHNAGKLPGDTEKIISNGTSAGGALSTLIGATGDSKDYEPYLKAMYPSYINSLPLVDKNGKALTLDENGRGSFADYIKSIYMASAQKALDNGTDLSSKTWPTINDGKVTDIDLAGYAVDVTRLKSAPAFDALNMSSAETEEFGTATVDKQHFTVYGKDHSTVAGSALADKDIVKTMNPLNYIGKSGVKTAHYWRIRYGEADRDTTIAVPAVVALRLQQAGYDVDFASPWARGHAGDYDLDELFAWMDAIGHKN